MATTISMQPVLIVDDDGDIREILGEVLCVAGYRVHAVPDGEPALELLHASQQRQEHWVVLLDLNMPGMDGSAVLHAVAAQRPLATCHAYILMTANERTIPRALVTLLTQLRVPIVAKPFDIDTIVDIVAHASARLLANAT
jgi:CheY-like chemotaxis protein